MSNAEEYSPLEKTLMEIIKSYEEDNKELVDALRESNLQIEYLHKKFQATGSGNTIISRNESLITKHTPKE